jgi:hypothetical protein
LPMHTARIPPVDPAPATIAAALAMHTGHICPSFGLLICSFPFDGLLCFAKIFTLLRAQHGISLPVQLRAQLGCAGKRFQHCGAILRAGKAFL